MQINTFMKPNQQHAQKKQTSCHTHRPTFTHTYSFFITCSLLRGIRQQLTDRAIWERLRLSACAWPLFMHLQWVRVEETIGGKGLSIPNLLLHAKGGVSDNHEGNFSRTNGHSELHHWVRMPLFLWNQTHPHNWHGKLSGIEMSLQQGGLNFWSSQFPHLWHDRSSMIPPFAVPPLSASSSSRLSLRHSPMISYTVCTFDQQSWIMVFRFFKLAWMCARAENGKQTRVHHPLFLLNSNVS